MNKLLKIIPLLALAALLSAATQPAPEIDMAALVARTSPGAGQQALQPLVGKWRVTKSIFVLGPPGRPLMSENMTTERKWIADGRFLSDTTTGLVGGKPYFRTGTLGYNNMDRRYEWTTADNQTPIMMNYYSAKGSGTDEPINMVGSFTDPGVTGDKNVGQTIPMRTTIHIVSNDRHIYQIFFTPPGQPEMLADRMIFDRIK